MIKPKLWKGNDLKGTWLATFKIDGVRAIIKDGVAKSRNGKPLYNLDLIPDGDYEIFCGSWEDTITGVRTKLSKTYIGTDAVYSLDPVDPRLKIYNIIDPCAPKIEQLLDNAIRKGYEGVVLRQGDIWLKVKREETYDVTVTGMVEGQGRLKGKLGAFVTPKGNVGTGFTDALRKTLWNDRDSLLHKIIEVECMELTVNGKFRHPRFIRVRYDK